MTKDTLFKAVCGAVGAVVGAVVGYFTGAHRGRKKGYSEAMERYLEANTGLDEEPAPSPDAKLSVEEKLEDIVSHYDEPEETDLEVGGIDFGEKADVLEEEITSYSKPKKNKGKAHAISLDEFGSDGYSTITVLLYREDATLTESDGETVIQNWKEVGAEVIQKLILDDEHDRAYTRNDVTQTDYEIVALDEKFADEGGVSD